MNFGHLGDEISTVAVVGLGLMGRSIVTCLLTRGFRVIGCDDSSATYEPAENYIARGHEELVEFGAIDHASAANWKDRFLIAASYDDWPPCDFVIESIVEDVNEKDRVFDRIEDVVGASVPIASNTSAIPITQLQRSRRNPERLLGMHWAEPAHATRFLEIIPGEHTSAATIEAAVILARRCGKDPSILAKDIAGFIANRLGYALYREALYLVELGVADAATIDRSFRNTIGVWSTICGPFSWMDLTGGPALYAKCMEGVLPTLSNATDIPDAMQRLADEGARGVLNGHGFFEYSLEGADAANAQLHKHAWSVLNLMNAYRPLPEA